MVASHKITQFLLVQILHYFPHVLGMVAGGNEQGVCGLDDHKIIYPQRGHEFVRCVNIIAMSFEREGAISSDQIAIR